MFWLEMIGIAVLLAVGIFVIAFLEDTLVSAPLRRKLERQAREKLGKKGD